MFKCIKVFLIFAVLISCNATQNLDMLDESLEKTADEVYVCYNTESEEHGKPCSSECLSIASAFCWMLKKEFCTGAPVYEWQRNNCHLFD